MSRNHLFNIETVKEMKEYLALCMKDTNDSTPSADTLNEVPFQRQRPTVARYAEMIYEHGDIQLMKDDR